MRWWTRVQMAQSLIGQGINTLMLSMAVAPAVGGYLGCRALWVAMALPVLILLALALVGLAMDRCQWMQRHEEQTRARSRIWAEVFARLERIERGRK